MNCPSCGCVLTPDQVRSLYAALASSKRKQRKGWPKGKPRKPKS